MTSDQIPPHVALILNKLGISPSQLVGKGGEGYIFALDSERVIKIYEKVSDEYLPQLKSLQNLLLNANLTFATPQILEIHDVDGIHYTIEKRLTGKPLDSVLSSLKKKQQKLALKNYLEAVFAFNTIEIPAHPFGQILNINNSITANTWQDFLIRKLVQRAEISESWLRRDVLNYEPKLRLLHKIITNEVRCDKKNLVHADYYFNNVLVNDNLEISAVLDFSEHAVVGDKRLDAASISFLTLDRHISQQHVEFSRNFIIDLYGKDVEKYLDIYALYYAIYYADTQEFDQNSYKWCLSILNNAQIWERLEL